jgi:hypothetical protein
VISFEMCGNDDDEIFLVPHPEAAEDEQQQEGVGTLSFFLSGYKLADI